MANFDTELTQLAETANNGHAGTVHAVLMLVVHDEACYQHKQSYGEKLNS